MIYIYVLAAFVIWFGIAFVLVATLDHAINLFSAQQRSLDGEE